MPLFKTLVISTNEKLHGFGPSLQRLEKFAIFPVRMRIQLQPCAVWLIAMFLLVAVKDSHAAEATKTNSDIVTAKCSLDRTRIEAGSPIALVAKADAVDQKKHALAYVWSGNGGKIRGAGNQVEVDTTNLQPGNYSLTVIARDAFENTDTCTIAFDVVEPGAAMTRPVERPVEPKLTLPAPSAKRHEEPKPAIVTPTVKRKETPLPVPSVRPTAPPIQETVSSRDSVTVACSTKSPVVEQGKDADVEADAKDPMGHSLKYIWYSNGGKIEGHGASAQLQTSGVRPAEYTVTARVEDGYGQAGACNVMVKVIPPIPAPPPLQPSHIGQVVFLTNRNNWDAKASS